MKLTVTQAALKQALSTAGRAVSTRSSLPVLGNYLLTAEGETLSVRASNLSLDIEARCPAQVSEPGAITLPAKLLAEWVGNVAGDVRIETTQAMAALECGRVRANMRGIDASEFPLAPVNESEPVSIPTAALKTLAMQTAYAAADDISRPALTAVCLTGDGESLSAAATDGYRLAVAEIASAAKVAALVPASALTEIARLADGESITLRIGRNGMTTTLAWATVHTALIDAKFPDWGAFLPKKSTTTITGDRAMLLEGVRVGGLFARDDSDRITLGIHAGGLTVRSQSAETGDGCGEVTAGVVGEPLEVVVSSKYLADAVSACPGEQVQLGLTVPTRPLKVTPAVGNGYTAVIMPMQLTR